MATDGSTYTSLGATCYHCFVTFSFENKDPRSVQSILWPKWAVERTSDVGICGAGKLFFENLEKKMTQAVCWRILYPQKTPSTSEMSTISIEILFVPSQQHRSIHTTSANSLGSRDDEQATIHKPIESE